MNFLTATAVWLTIYVAVHVFRSNRQIKLQEKQRLQAERFEANAENREQFDRIRSYFVDLVPQASFTRIGDGKLKLEFYESLMLAHIDQLSARSLNTSYDMASLGYPVGGAVRNDYIDTISFIQRNSREADFPVSHRPFLNEYMQIPWADTPAAQNRLREALSSPIGLGTGDAAQYPDLPSMFYGMSVGYTPSSNNKVQETLRAADATRIVPVDKVLRRLQRVEKLTNEPPQKHRA